MSNSAHTLITNRVFNIELPATKSVVENNQADLSKNSREFRNLDAHFLVDNGYIRFADDDNDFTLLSAFIKTAKISIRNNLFKIPVGTDGEEIDSDEVNIIPLSMEELAEITNAYSTSELEVEQNIPLVVAFASDKCTIKIHPGQHHIVEAIDHTPNIPTNEDRLHRLYQSLSELPEYIIDLNRHDFVYFIPNLLRKVECDKNFPELVWFKVIDAREKTVFSKYNFVNFDAMIDQFRYTLIETINSKSISWIPIDILKKIVAGFKDLQERGWGQLMNISEETLTFRVRVASSDQIMHMNEPSLYEATFEVVYYHDMSKRIQQSNYSKMDRFEVRTSGFIARRRNYNYTVDLYNLCNARNDLRNDDDSNEVDNSDESDDSRFEFDILRVVDYLRNSSFNDTIKRWYPKDEKIELSGMCLSNIKTYSTMVFKYRTLDQKNITRMLMIEDWIKELDIKGGFVISDASEKRNDPKRHGYLIVSGESIVYGHTGKTGDMNTFLERYDSFHWKRVKRYTDKSSDFLFDMKYESLPESYFVITHNTLGSDDEYSAIQEIVRQFS